MSAVLSPMHFSAAPPRLSAQQIAHDDLLRLFTRAEGGHIGHYGYLGHGAEIVNEFYTTHKAYYPHRGDFEFLTENAQTIADRMKDTRRLIIVGPGPVIKESVFLSHLPNLQEVLLIDVSEEFCVNGQRSLAALFNQQGRPNVRVNTLVHDYLTAAPFVKKVDGTTVISTGSLLSNVTQKPNEDFPETQMLAALNAFRRLARGRGGRVAVGYDSCQDPDQIEESYNHPAFDRFVLNCLGQAFETAAINNINSQNVGDYFERRTVTGHGVFPHHTIVAKDALRLPFQSAGRSDGIVVNVQADDAFTAMNSVKPLSNQVGLLGKDAGLYTDIVFTSGSGMTMHLMPVA